VKPGDRRRRPGCRPVAGAVGAGAAHPDPRRDRDRCREHARGRSLIAAARTAPHTSSRGRRCHCAAVIGAGRDVDRRRRLDERDVAGRRSASGASAHGAVARAAACGASDGAARRSPGSSIATRGARGSARRRGRRSARAGRPGRGVPSDPHAAAHPATETRGTATWGNHATSFFLTGKRRCMRKVPTEYPILREVSDSRPRDNDPRFMAPTKHRGAAVGDISQHTLCSVPLRNLGRRMGTIDVD
jgi:hypothetical protein